MFSQQWTEIEELVTRVLLSQFNNLSVNHIRRVRDLLRQSQVSRLWYFTVHEKVIGSIEDIHPSLLHQIPPQTPKKLTGLTDLDYRHRLLPTHTNLRVLTIDSTLPQITCPEKVREIRLLSRKTYIPIDITPFTNLTTLELGHVNDPYLPGMLITLTNLRNLHLTSNIAISTSDIIPLDIKILKLSGKCPLIYELPKLTQLTSLSLSPKNMERVDELICGLTGLVILNLENVKLVSEKCLLGMTQIRKLFLGKLKVTDYVFNKALGSLTLLEELCFTNRTKSDYSVSSEVIRSMTRLKRLTLRGTTVQDKLVDSLPKSLIYLDASLRPLKGCLSHLKNLVTFLDSGYFGVEMLATLPSLRHFSTMRDITLELERKPLTNLQSLTYLFTEEPSLQVMTKLVSLRNLHVRTWTSCKISSETDAAFHKHGINLHYRSF